MIGLGEDLTSSITDLRRFSNSPFTPAPACNSPKSSVRSETSLRGIGTSPAAIRNANPSATAVLPTPASPVRIGLFCRRRVNISMTCRISVSRPKTASIFPSRARAVKSMVNWSSEGVSRLIDPPAERRVADAVAPLTRLVASRSSAVSAQISSMLLRKASALIFSNWRDAPRADRLNDSLESSASSKWPERICPAE